MMFIHGKKMKNITNIKPKLFARAKLQANIIKQRETSSEGMGVLFASLFNLEKSFLNKRLAVYIAN